VLIADGHLLGFNRKRVIVNLSLEMLNLIVNVVGYGLVLLCGKAVEC
jgi:hypothetical protein